MRIMRIALSVLVLAAAAFPQNKDLGMGAFANDKAAIKLAVDAGLVDFKIDGPYVMLVIYMASGQDGQNLTVNRKDVVMVYQGKTLSMPGVAELRKEYGAQIHDLDFYRHLGKEGIFSSWIKFYDFPTGPDFFPTMMGSASLAVDEGSMSALIGFRTKVYFKNPGFSRGDKFVIQVRDKKDPALTGEVEVTLK
jgi:hypothetical protein